MLISNAKIMFFRLTVKFISLKMPLSVKFILAKYRLTVKFILTNCPLTVKFILIKMRLTVNFSVGTIKHAEGMSLQNQCIYM